MDCLVYVDPSPRGEWVLTLAAQLPREYADRLVLLATEEDAARDDGLLARARARVAATGARLEEKRLPGPAERAIVEEAAAHDYGLVVVPPAGRNALQRMLKGSRVATVVRGRPRVGAGGAPAPGARRADPGRGVRRAAHRGGGPMPAWTWSGRSAHVPLSSTSRRRWPCPSSDPARPERTRPRIRALAARQQLAVHGRSSSSVKGWSWTRSSPKSSRGPTTCSWSGRPPERGPAAWGREDTTERLLLACPVSVLIVRGP